MNNTTKTATVIIPTTGAIELRKSIESVLSQTQKDVVCYVVCDGKRYNGKVKPICSDYLGNENIQVCYLPENVGANGFYGHRIYAAFSHLINTDYVLYLDQDNWYQPNHVESCIQTIKNNDLDWCYSLRNIYKGNEYVCKDDCESLGKYPSYHGVHLVDTNNYCINKNIVTKIASAWHGGWGQDRVFLSAMATHFPKFDCTGEYTVNYRVNGNDGSVTDTFFINGNKKMNEKYNGEYPWVKKI